MACPSAAVASPRPIAPVCPTDSGSIPTRLVKDFATAEELMLLPHVDEEIAQRIIEFREKGGGFSNEYELLLIEGLSRSEASEIIKYTKVK